MSFDQALVFGLIVLVFAIPAIVSAFSDGRAPRAASIIIVIGGGLSAWALTQKPGGYTLDQMPEVFVKVIRDLLG